MSDAQISIDQWVAEERNRLPAKEREALQLFQKDWHECSRSNPLLFPPELEAGAWNEQFVWFVRVESFVPASSEAAVSPKTVAKPKIFDDAETVILGPDTGESGLNDLETIIMEQAPKKIEPGPGPEAPETDGAETVILDTGPDQDALDGLDALLVEGGEEKKAVSAETPAVDKEAAVIIGADKQPPSKAEKTESPEREKPAEKKENLELELGDLDTMEWMDE
ncbi:MAG: hypothetical protein SV487_07645 [Thermodesulfobacteriota bacterium]|nr:hypothetical protein [Thermodesulfobacteriota bacterium]